MRRPSVLQSCIAAVFATSLGANELAVGDRVSFIACPVAQDLGEREDLCFFAEYRGQRISLNTNTFDSTGTMLKHKMLVEGRIVAGPTECGGSRLEGMASSLSEVSPECNDVRPFDSNILPSDPRNHDEAEIKRRLRADPSLSVRPTRTAVERFAGDVPRTWQMTYTFDSDRGDGVSLQALVLMVKEAIQINASAIVVNGYRGASLLDDGAVLSERPGLARQRAEKIRSIIDGLGFPATKVPISFHEEPAPATGRDDWLNRKVTAQLLP